MSSEPGDSFTDTFILQIALTNAIMLDLLSDAYGGQDSHAYLDAMEKAVKQAFGEGYSYDMVSKTHKITNSSLAIHDNNTYLVVSFEHRAS